MSDHEDPTTRPGKRSVKMKSCRLRDRMPEIDSSYWDTEIERCFIHGRRGCNCVLAVLPEAVDGTRLNASKGRPDTRVLLVPRSANR